MVTKTKVKYAQVYNPQTKRWVKINSRPGYIIGSKGTAGAYKGIPKQRHIPKWLQKMWDRAESQRHTTNPHRTQPRSGKTQRRRGGNLLFPYHLRVPEHVRKRWDKVKGEPRQRPGGKPQVRKTRRVSPPPQLSKKPQVRKTRRVSPPPQLSKKPQVPKYRPGHHPISVPLRRSGSSGTARVRRMR